MVVIIGCHEFNVVYLCHKCFGEVVHHIIYKFQYSSERVSLWFLPFFPFNTSPLSFIFYNA